MAMPPQQPPPAWNAPCDKPDNAYNLAWWGDYETCYWTSWFAWSPGNAEQLKNLSQGDNSKEPFGTMNEISGSLGLMRDVFGGQDWSSGPSYNGFDTSIFTNPDGSIYADDGALSFGNAQTYSTAYCATTLPGAGGPFLLGVCWMLAFLRYWKFLGIFQWFINGASIILFLGYVVSKWIVKATG